MSPRKQPKNNESNYATHAPTIRLFVETGKQGQVTLMYMLRIVYIIFSMAFQCISNIRPEPRDSRLRGAIEG